MNADVLIVGGGLAGLACATALSDNGLRVVLAEAEPRLGGRAASCADPVTGDLVDLGPHVLLTEYPNLRKFLRSLGTHDLIAWDHDQLLTLVDQGRVTRIRSSWLPAPFHLLPSLIEAPGLGTGDLLSNHRTSWLAMRAGTQDLQSLDAMDALTFLRRMNASRRLIDWFWASAAMAVMNVPLERCSAGALLRFYRILIANRELRFGLPQCALSELFAEQAARRVEAGGGRVLLRSPVVELTTDGHAVTGAALATGEAIRSRFCVCALPPGPLARILPSDVACPTRADLHAFEPSPYVSSYIWFDRKLSAARNWARTWSPGKLNYDFYDLSNIRRGWSARPSVIAGNIIYSHRAHGLTDDEIIRATVREIAEYIPAAARVRIHHARVHRLEMAIPCPLPGLEARRPRPRTSLPGLFLAGDWVATDLPFSMESAVRGGWLAAEQVLEAAGRPRRLAQEVTKTRGLLRFTTRRAGTLDGPRLASFRQHHNGPCQEEITMTTTQRDSLTSWLKDAHAMKSARIENLERQSERYDDFPDLQRKLRDHVEGSRHQMAELESCLSRLGADPSALKEAASKATSKLQGWTTAAAPDEAVKNAIADEAFAEFEAASFEALAVAAAECGEEEISRACARMRDEERQVADWFRSEIPGITRSFLARRAAA